MGVGHMDKCIPHITPNLHLAINFHLSFTKSYRDRERLMGGRETLTDPFTLEASDDCVCYANPIQTS